MVLLKAMATAAKRTITTAETIFAVESYDAEKDCKSPGRTACVS